MFGKAVAALLVLNLVLANGSLENDDDDEKQVGDSSRPGRKSRQGGFFNVFQVISFANGPCIGGSRNGTCYTEQECSSRGGSNGGSCASGFGVCCIIAISCGQQSSENCTYFESSGVMAGCCQAEICPCGDNICQLRLDFDTFTISGPSTQVASVAKRRQNSGAITVNFDAATAVPVSNFGQCLTDTFSVSNPDGPNPPTICGVNNGQHMYVESSDCCNKLSFNLGANGVGTTVANRNWNIKVTQYSCDYKNLAPQGCVQYFFDSANSVVQSYNYNNGNGVHLSSQDQINCIRRERNNCRICWTTVNDADFAISGSAPYKDFNANQCCDYGAPKTKTAAMGFDCLVIPGAVRGQATAKVGGPTPSYQCGNNQGLKRDTVCSNRTPFTLHFRSDKWETALEAGMGGQMNNNGFMLVYFMDANSCNPANLVNVM